MPTTPLTLSQSKLATFLICQQRFHLRFLRQLPWPAPPHDDQAATSLAQGQQFHQLLERHFLGFAETAVSPADPHLHQWWQAFQHQPPPLPPGRRLPEISLTIPVAGHLLTGRFDLLIAGVARDMPFLHLFDWKTSRPAPAAELRRSWQTRLYLALLAQGGHAFSQKTAVSPIAPDRIKLSYWYASAADKPVTIAYNAAWHTENWRDIQTLVARIDHSQANNSWPLTDDLSLCRACPYQIYCHRQTTGIATARFEPDMVEPEAIHIPLEPQTP